MVRRGGIIKRSPGIPEPLRSVYHLASKADLAEALMGLAECINQDRVNPFPEEDASHLWACRALAEINLHREGRGARRISPDDVNDFE